MLLILTIGLTNLKKVQKSLYKIYTSQKKYIVLYTFEIKYIPLYIVYTKDLYKKKVEFIVQKRLKRLKMKKQKGLKLGQLSKLTKVQQEVLRLTTQEYMTPVKIANLRGTSLTAVYKTLKLLEEKGVLNHDFKKVEKGDHRGGSTTIRLHAQHFVINIIKKGNNYQNILNKSNIIQIDTNTIKLHNNNIEVYSNVSFTGKDVNEATQNSFHYWNRFFKRLEHDLDLTLVKTRHQNIRLVQNHYAETNNDLAKEVNKTNEKIRVYTSEDDKMWFEIDNSFNLHEAETTHPITAKADMGNIIQPFFNDLRNNQTKLPSIQTKELDELKGIVFEIGSGLNNVVKLLTPKEHKEQETIKIVPFYVG